MPNTQFRDGSNGQFAFQNNWERMCVCGHTLGVHGEGGFDCLNGTGVPNQTKPRDFCDCKKFRQSRKKPK